MLNEASCRLFYSVVCVPTNSCQYANVLFVEALAVCDSRLGAEKGGV